MVRGPCGVPWSELRQQRLSTQVLPCMVAVTMDRLVAGPCGARYLVVNIIFSDRLPHRDAFDLRQAVGIVDDDGAIHVPDAEQGIAAVTRELDVRGGLTG